MLINKRNKQIDILYHFEPEAVRLNEVTLPYFCSDKQSTEVQAKHVFRVFYERLGSLLGVLT